MLIVLNCDMDTRSITITSKFTQHTYVDVSDVEDIESDDVISKVPLQPPLDPPQQHVHCDSKPSKHTHPSVVLCGNMSVSESKERQREMKCYARMKSTADISHMTQLHR